MDLSGIIFVVLALAWAVYLIPKALKHHDEVARTRSIDRFSTAMRVLARREPVNHRDTRLVVTPARTASNPRVLAPSRSGSAEVPVVEVPVVEVPVVEVAVEPAVSRARLDARRKAARAAARRRRRILTFLLLCDVVVASVAYLGYAPWWSLAVPGGLTLLYLVLCRTQVRGEAARDLDVLTSRPDAEPTASTPSSQVVVVDEVVLAEEYVDGHRVADLDDGEDTGEIRVGLLAAAVAPSVEDGTLWDPLPVTLPTYVTKPTAKRTVRTIDLGEPGTWTSGRTAEDAEVVATSASDEAGSTGSGKGEQRAVGS